MVTSHIDTDTTTVTAPPQAAMMEAIHVFDAVMPDPIAYRALALAQSFQTHQTGDETWRGIALLPLDQALPQVMHRLDPRAETRLTFFRQSPRGQAEPNFVHSDEGMGEWTAILYLTPDPPAEDGTTFWRYRPTGAVAGSARDLDKDPALWEPWRRVEARFNRLLVFDARLFHSRSIAENYGTGDDARLVQVAFGTWRRTGIRDAVETDAPAVIAMAQRFVASTRYQPLITLDPVRVHALLRSLIANPDAVCLVAEDEGRLLGILALVIAEHPLSGDRVAGELVWWVDQDARGSAGVRLYRTAEAWACARGAVVLQMIAPDARVGQFYQARGFTQVETAWQKRIG